MASITSALGIALLGTIPAIGTGAVATKYSIFASLSNTPIAYMGIAGVLVFLLISVASKSLHQQYLERRGRA